MLVFYRTLEKNKNNKKRGIRKGDGGDSKRDLALIQINNKCWMEAICLKVSFRSMHSSSSRLRLIGTLEILDYKVYDGVKCTEAG